MLFLIIFLLSIYVIIRVVVGESCEVKVFTESFNRLSLGVSYNVSGRRWLKVYVIEIALVFVFISFTVVKIKR